MGSRCSSWFELTHFESCYPLVATVHHTTTNHHFVEKMHHFQHPERLISSPRSPRCCWGASFSHVAGHPGLWVLQKRPSLRICLNWCACYSSCVPVFYDGTGLDFNSLAHQHPSLTVAEGIHLSQMDSVYVIRYDHRLLLRSFLRNLGWISDFLITLGFLSSCLLFFLQKYYLLNFYYNMYQNFIYDKFRKK